jgi:1-deoxy-D-xylulose-5-phosphate reductoisomerase
MRLPIGFALAFPDRLPQAPELAATRSALGLRGERSTLTFEPDDDARFPCLRLAYRAAQSGQTYPAVLSAANEEAGRAFLQGKIRFDQIGALVRAALDAHNGLPPTMPNIEEADRWARSFTKDAISTKA